MRKKEDRYAVAAAFCLLAMMFTFEKTYQPGMQIVWSLLMGMFAIGAVFFVIAAARAER